MARDNLETVLLNPADCSDTALTFKTAIKKHGRKDKNEAASILMMKPIAAISILALLAACGDSIEEAFGDFSNGDAAEDDGGLPPSDEGVEGEDTPSGEFTNTGGAGTVPSAISNNLLDVSYTPGASTITVSGTGFDTTSVSGTYTRNAALDVAGYTAYTVQEDPLDRMYIALVRESANGAVEGGVVLEGGQFGEFFGGAFYRRNEGYTAYTPSQPNEGLVSYSGTYVGLNNGNARGTTGQILDLPAGTDPAVAPSESDRVTGNVLINADFADNQISGTVFDRQEIASGAALDSLFLDATNVDEDGTFSGNVTLRAEGLPSVGSYAGGFGGTQAEGVAGAIQISGYDEDRENEAEFGSFVLSRCGTAGEGSLCSVVDPE